MYNKRTSPNRFPTLINYEEAKAHEESIKPIRGTSIKPIGKRRDKHVLIRRDEPSGNIVCRLYETDIITYKPDGVITLNLNGWASDLTTTVMSHVLGVRIRRYDLQMWVDAKFGSGEEVLRFPLRSKGDTNFTRAGYGPLVILDPVRSVIHKINRTKTREVRATFKPFMDYVDAMCRLRADERGSVRISNEEFTRHFGADEVYGMTRQPLRIVVTSNTKPTNLTVREFKNLITKREGEDKTTDFLEAFIWLANSSYFGWLGTTRDRMLDTLDEFLLYAHRDVVFEEVEIFGQMARDMYGKYF